MSTNLIFAWALFGVFAVAEIAILVTTVRAHRQARANGETRTHGTSIEATWVLLPGLAVLLLFAFSLLQGAK